MQPMKVFGPNIRIKTRRLAPDLGNILEVYGTLPSEYKMGLVQERSGLIHDASKRPGQELMKVCFVV